MSLIKYKNPTSGAWEVLNNPININGKLNFVSVDVSADKKSFDLSQYITDDTVDFILFYSIGDGNNQTGSTFYKAIFIPEENRDDSAQFLGLSSSTGTSGGIHTICNRTYSAIFGGGDFTDSNSVSSSFGSNTDVLTYQNRKLTTTTCFGNKAILAYVG